MHKSLSCRQLAKLAGVSVRTLHYYDRLGLLKPAVRTEARYRLYGEQEQLRLQQILFFKELDFALSEIQSLLEDPDFNLLAALEQHKQALQARQQRLATLLVTLDNTIAHVKGDNVMLTNEELYAGFPKEQAETYRREASDKYGPEVVAEAENKVRQLGKEGFAALKAEQESISQTLLGMMHLAPASEEVQQQISRHFANIQAFWGPSVGAGGKLAEAYKGLAQLYLDDPRYTTHHGQSSPGYANFLSEAMIHFADTKLSS